MASIKNNFLLNSAYQLINMAVPIVTTPYLSRVLHAEGIGVYTFAYTIAYYFVIVSMLGINNYGNRTIASAHDKKNYNFWSIYSLQFIVGISVFLIYLFYVLLFNRNFILLIFSIYVFSSILDINWFFWGLEKFKITVSRNIIIKLITTILIFILVKGETDIWKYALITSLGFLLSQIILWIYLFREVSLTKVTINSIKKHLKPILILFIPVIGVSIYKIIDRIMLGMMSTSSELGYFESSEKIIQIPVAFVVSLGIVMLPRMAQVISQNDAEKEDYYLRRSSNFAIVFSSFICFLIIAVSDQFVPLFYGPGFDKCIVLYFILLPSCIFLALSNVVRTQYLIPKSLDSIYVKAVTIGAVTNICLNLVLIPTFASVGVAISTLITEAVVCIYQIVKIKNQPIFIICLKKRFKLILLFATVSVVIFHLPDILEPFVNLIIKCIAFISLSLLILCANILIFSKKLNKKFSFKTCLEYFDN